MLLKIVEILRIIFGGAYIMFLPGFVLSFVIFKKLSLIERLTYSIALSISVVPIAVYWGYKLGFVINSINILIETSLLIVLIIMILLIQKYFIKSYENNSNSFRGRL